MDQTIAGDELVFTILRLQMDLQYCQNENSYLFFWLYSDRIRYLHSQKKYVIPSLNQNILMVSWSPGFIDSVITLNENSITHE